MSSANQIHLDGSYRVFSHSVPLSPLHELLWVSPGHGPVPSPHNAGRGRRCNILEYSCWRVYLVCANVSGRFRITTDQFDAMIQHRMHSSAVSPA